MDAMPVRMDQTLEGWAEQLKQQFANLQAHTPAVQTLALGGTAVGTGISAPGCLNLYRILSNDTDLNFQRASNFFALIGSQDTAVSLSGGLKSTAVTLMKIANDLRWMNSNAAGLGEIATRVAAGIIEYAGQVNPVIPEAVAMVAAQVMQRYCRNPGRTIR